MNKRNIILSIFAVLLIHVFASNIASADNTKKLLPEQDIISEYKYIRAKRIDGYYGLAGSKGAKIMKGYEANLANYLSIRTKAKTCQDLQKRIPSLETGYYSFLFEKKISNSLFSMFNISPANLELFQKLYAQSRPPQVSSKRCNSVASIMTAIRPVL